MTWTRLALGCALLSLLAAAPARGATPRDWDGDGAIAGDCAPLDAAIHPGAPDAPDLSFADTNCDGVDGDAAGAVWVAPTGSDAAAGTLSAPLATIQAAIDKGASAVLIEAGTYTQRVVLHPGVSLYGGYAADGSRSRANVVTVQAPAGAAEAIFADAVTGLVLQLLTIRGATPSAANGSSSYGVRAIAGSSLALIADDVAAGAAANGAAGATGATGGQGSAGGRGTDGNAQENSSSATTGASTGGAGGGGEGGVGGRGADYGGALVTAGQNGSDGTAAAGSHGTGGAPGSPSDRTELGNGTTTNGFRAGAGAAGGPAAASSAGSTGGPGVGGSADTTQAGTTWSGPSGLTGVTGGQGAAGGGGGGGQYGFFSASDCGGDRPCACPCAYYGGGGGGGGGGAGGLGGPGGEGGQPGGASVAVYLSDSTAAISGSTLTGGQGGAGGDGGLGGAGGLGGTGGPGGRGGGGGIGASGGKGGDGAPGGPGGAGGGGAGGPSAGLLTAGASSYVLRDASAATAGMPGAGGHVGGGADPAVSGQSGATLGAVTAPSTASDFDGDGVVDAADECVVTAGPVRGCPALTALADRDGDGVPDVDDACPATAAGNDDGCPTPLPAPPADADHDGANVTTDCNDHDASVHPGAVDVPGDKIDQDCSGADAAKPHVASRVSVFWTVKRKTATVNAWSIKELPAKARITVACSGPKCPFKTRAVKANGKSLNLRKALKGRLAFRAGAKVTVTISAPGMVAKVMRYTIRAGKLPLQTVR